jgi:hypothetical protein
MAEAMGAAAGAVAEAQAAAAQAQVEATVAAATAAATAGSTGSEDDKKDDDKGGEDDDSSDDSSDSGSDDDDKDDQKGDASSSQSQVSTTPSEGSEDTGRRAPIGVSDINWERVGGILVTDPPPMAEGSGYSAVDTSSSGAMASMVGPEDDGGGGYDPHARRMPDQAEVTDPPEDKGSMKGMQKGI